MKLSKIYFNAFDKRTGRLARTAPFELTLQNPQWADAVDADGLARTFRKTVWRIEMIKGKRKCKHIE